MESFFSAEFSFSSSSSEGFRCGNSENQVEFQAILEMIQKSQNIECFITKYNKYLDLLYKSVEIYDTNHAKYSVLRKEICEVHAEQLLDPKKNPSNSNDTLSEDMNERFKFILTKLLQLTQDSYVESLKMFMIYIVFHLSLIYLKISGTTPSNLCKIILALNHLQVTFVEFLQLQQSSELFLFSRMAHSVNKLFSALNKKEKMFDCNMMMVIKGSMSYRPGSLVFPKLSNFTDTSQYLVQVSSLLSQMFNFLLFYVQCELTESKKSETEIRINLFLDNISKLNLCQTLSDAGIRSTQTAIFHQSIQSVTHSLFCLINTLNSCIMPACYENALKLSFKLVVDTLNLYTEKLKNLQTNFDECLKDIQESYGLYCNFLLTCTGLKIKTEFFKRNKCSLLICPETADAIYNIFIESVNFTEEQMWNGLDQEISEHLCHGCELILNSLLPNEIHKSLKVFCLLFQHRKIYRTDKMCREVFDRIIFKMPILLLRYFAKYLDLQIFPLSAINWSPIVYEVETYEIINLIVQDVSSSNDEFFLQNFLFDLLTASKKLKDMQMHFRINIVLAFLFCIRIQEDKNKRTTKICQNMLLMLDFTHIKYHREPSNEAPICDTENELAGRNEIQCLIWLILKQKPFILWPVLSSYYKILSGSREQNSWLNFLFCISHPLFNNILCVDWPDMLVTLKNSHPLLLISVMHARLIKGHVFVFEHHIGLKRIMQLLSSSLQYKPQSKGMNFLNFLKERKFAISIVISNVFHSLDNTKLRDDFVNKLLKHVEENGMTTSMVEELVQIFANSYGIYFANEVKHSMNVLIDQSYNSKLFFDLFLLAGLSTYECSIGLDQFIRVRCKEVSLDMDFNFPEIKKVFDIFLSDSVSELFILKWRRFQEYVIRNNIRLNRELEYLYVLCERFSKKYQNMSPPESDFNSVCQTTETSGVQKIDCLSIDEVGNNENPSEEYSSKQNRSVESVEVPSSMNELKSSDQESEFASCEGLDVNNDDEDKQFSTNVDAIILYIRCYDEKISELENEIKTKLEMLNSPPETLNSLNFSNLFGELPSIAPELYTEVDKFLNHLDIVNEIPFADCSKLIDFLIEVDHKNKHSFNLFDSKRDFSHAIIKIFLKCEDLKTKFEYFQTISQHLEDSTHFSVCISSGNFLNFIPHYLSMLSAKAINLHHMNRCQEMEEEMIIFLRMMCFKFKNGCQDLVLLYDEDQMVNLIEGTLTFMLCFGSNKIIKKKITYQCSIIIDLLEMFMWKFPVENCVSMLDRILDKFVHLMDHFYLIQDYHHVLHLTKWVTNKISELNIDPNRWKETIWKFGNKLDSTQHKCYIFYNLFSLHTVHMYAELNKMLAQTFVLFLKRSLDSNHDDDENETTKTISGYEIFETLFIPYKEIIFPSPELALKLRGISKLNQLLNVYFHDFTHLIENAIEIFQKIDDKICNVLEDCIKSFFILATSSLLQYNFTINFQPFYVNEIRKISNRKSTLTLNDLIFMLENTKNVYIFRTYEYLITSTNIENVLSEDLDTLVTIIFQFVLIDWTLNLKCCSSFVDILRKLAKSESFSFLSITIFEMISCLNSLMSMEFKNEHIIHLLILIDIMFSYIMKLPKNDPLLLDSLIMYQKCHSSLILFRYRFIRDQEDTNGTHIQKCLVKYWKIVFSNMDKVIKRKLPEFDHVIVDIALFYLMESNCEIMNEAFFYALSRHVLCNESPQKFKIICAFWTVAGMCVARHPQLLCAKTDLECCENPYMVENLLRICANYFFIDSKHLSYQELESSIKLPCMEELFRSSSLRLFVFQPSSLLNCLVMFITSILYDPQCIYATESLKMFVFCELELLSEMIVKCYSNTKKMVNFGSRADEFYIFTYSVFMYLWLLHYQKNVKVSHCVDMFMKALSDLSDIKQLFPRCKYIRSFCNLIVYILNSLRRPSMLSKIKIMWDKEKFYKSSKDLWEDELVTKMCDYVENHNLDIKNINTYFTRILTSHQMIEYFSKIFENLPNT